MTKQEALTELKDRVRCAGCVDAHCVDYVSKEALKIANGLYPICVFRWTG